LVLLTLRYSGQFDKFNNLYKLLGSCSKICTYTLKLQ
jgi:hypothetical protein